MMLIPLWIGFTSCVILIWALMRQQQQYVKEIETARMQVEQSLSALKELIEQ